MRLFLPLALLFLGADISAQKLGIYYDLKREWKYESDPFSGFHVSKDHIFFLTVLRNPDLSFEYELMSITKDGRVVDSLSTHIADTPLVGSFNLQQYMYGGNEEVILYYQQLSPADSGTWLGNAIERYDYRLRRKMNWRGQVIRYSTADLSDDGIITCFGEYEFGDRGHTVRFNQKGEKILDSVGGFLRAPYKLHRLGDYFYCFSDGTILGKLDSNAILLERSMGLFPSSAFAWPDISLLTADSALLVSYRIQHPDRDSSGMALAKIHISGKVIWNWVRPDYDGTAWDAATLPNGHVALAMAAYDDFRIVDQHGNAILRKHYEIGGQKKGNVGFRRIQFDPTDSTLWVAMSTSESFVGDSINYNGISILHLDMEGNPIDTTQNIVVTLVSLPEQKQRERISCFPNPAAHELRINLQEGLTNLPYCIYDLMGRSWQQGRLLNRQSPIDISGLPGGLYIVHVESDDRIFTSSFIKS